MSRDMTTAVAEPFWRVTSEQYHADASHVSHSAMEVFRKSIPLYHGRYVSGTIQHDPPSPAMQLGSAIHCAVLEPDRWADRYCTAPVVDRRTKAGKESWERFTEESAGRTPLTGEQVALVGRIAEGVSANRMARSLLDATGQNEVSIRWEDPGTGVPLKARFDRLIDAGFVVDLKTASDPGAEEFARAAHRYGYHRQAAIYLDGHRETLGRPAEFLHIVVGTQEPFECFVYELDARALELGRDENAATLRQLHRCRSSGEWESPLAHELNRLPLPPWAYKREGNQQ